VKLPLLLFATVVGLVVVTMGFTGTYWLVPARQSHASLVVLGVAAIGVVGVGALIWRMAHGPRNDSATSGLPPGGSSGY
jgi:hypothetical protein